MSTSSSPTTSSSSSKSPRKLTPSPLARVLDLRDAHSMRNGATHLPHRDDSPLFPLMTLDTHHSVPMSHPPYNGSHATEQTPLLSAASRSPSPLVTLPLSPLPSSRLLFWRPSSPSFRFFVLLLAMLIPFGPHLVKSSLSSLSSYFLHSPAFPLSHTQFGSFQSALSVPNLFIPFLGGLLLDLRGSPSGTTLFLLLTLVGHTLFTVSCSLHSYPSALLSRALFGLGQGSTVVAQGRIAGVYFQGHEMVFAIAVCESMHNLSALIARLYVVPLAQYTGSYINSLWVGVAACGLSMLAGASYWYLDPHVWREEARLRDLTAATDANPAAAEEAVDGDGVASTLHADHLRVPAGLAPSASSSSRGVGEESRESVADLLRRPSALPVTFLLLCLLHLVHSNSYHLFDYISASFIQHKYHVSVMDSAMLSSITSLFAIVLCPLAGWVLDHTGRKMYVVAACSVVTTAAFLLMAYSSLTPYCPLILLSLSISFVPTILRSAVPDCTPRALLGTAYGAYEVMESVGSVVGHVAVGAIVDVTGGYFGALCVFAGLSATSCVLALGMSVYDRAVGGTLNEKSGRWERRRKGRAEKVRRMAEEEQRALQSVARSTEMDRALDAAVYR